MSNDRSSPINVPGPESRPRRASIADLFSKQPASNSSARQPQGQANQQASQRRLSITTLGLSGSPTQTSAFGNQNFRRGSMSSSFGSNAPNAEDAVADDPDSSSPGATPSSPWARRVSFGAQALRDARAGSIGNGRYPPLASRSGPGPSPTGPTGSLAGARRSPPANATPTAAAQTRSSASTSSPLDEKSNPSRRVGEGFNWSEALRSRAERAPSIGGSISQPSSATRQSHNHQRAASIASMEQPVREIPKQPKQNKPDFFQEKILRGDFMD